VREATTQGQQRRRRIGLTPRFPAGDELQRPIAAAIPYLAGRPGLARGAGLRFATTAGFALAGLGFAAFAAAVTGFATTFAFALAADVIFALAGALAGARAVRFGLACSASLAIATTEAANSPTFDVTTSSVDFLRAMTSSQALR
jgi:hypothetical protein